MWWMVQIAVDVLGAFRYQEVVNGFIWFKVVLGVCRWLRKYQMFVAGLRCS